MKLFQSIWLALPLVAFQRASATELVFVATLDGPSESPPNNSLGVGSSVVTIDLDLVTMRLEVQFSNLSGTVTGSHIHMPTPTPGMGMAEGVTPLPTFPGFPSDVNAGAYDRTFDLTDPASYNPLFVEANGGSVDASRNALISGLSEGRAYLNIHSNVFIDGEIRGFYLTDPKADFNHDGVVSGADLAVWRAAFVTTDAGDANDDDLTDGQDFVLWQRQLGAIAQLPPAATPVPEPATALRLAMAGAIAIRARRRVPPRRQR